MEEVPAQCSDLLLPNMIPQWAVAVCCYSFVQFWENRSSCEVWVSSLIDPVTFHENNKDITAVTFLTGIFKHSVIKKSSDKVSAWVASRSKGFLNCHCTKVVTCISQVLALHETTWRFRETLLCFVL